MNDMTDTAARRPTKGERTRERVLDAATELFSASGFHAVSLRDIAAHAGLTHAGLLHHFPGKESLLIEVLGRRDREDGAVLLAIEPATEPEEFLARMVGIVARNMSTPGLVGLYTKLSTEAADPEHPAHRYFVTRYRVLRRQTTAAFAALAARSEPPARYDPALTAQALLATMDGLQTQWLLEPEAVDMRAGVVAFFAGLGLDFSRAPAFSDFRPAAEHPSPDPSPPPGATP